MDLFNDAFIRDHVGMYYAVAAIIGALRGLDSGRSAQVISAFLLAVRGNVRHALVLGIFAAISQMSVIWILAMVGFYYLPFPDMGDKEASFRIITGALVVGLVVWMIVRTRQGQIQERIRPEGNGPNHGMMVRTDNYWVEIKVSTDNDVPRFRIYFYFLDNTPTEPISPGKILFNVIRPDGTVKAFNFNRRDHYLESEEYVPAPHEFEVVLQFRHSDHGFAYRVRFVEITQEKPVVDDELGFWDDYGLDHVGRIQQQWVDKKASLEQVALFGLTSGLLSSQTAYAFLLLCFHFRNPNFGLKMLVAFMGGLAVALIMTGMIAVFSARSTSQKFKQFYSVIDKLLYVGALVLIGLGATVFLSGFRGGG